LAFIHVMRSVLGPDAIHLTYKTKFNKMKRDIAIANKKPDNSIFEISHKIGTGVENTLKISNLIYYFLYETSVNSGSQQIMNWNNVEFKRSGN
jgi:hypothetical protein